MNKARQPPQPGSTNARAIAARILARVLARGASLDRALEAELGNDTRGRALVQELAFGVLRWHERLAALRAALVRKPLRSADTDVACLLEMGLYQLIHMRVPAHAAVHETVRAADALRKGWAKPLVNGALRHFQRRACALQAEVDQAPQARFAHPGWLLQRLETAYPADWQAICAAANARPPMTLRVNRAVTTRERYLASLQAAGLEAHAHGCVETALELTHPSEVHALPGFAQGQVSVQDAAAQLAAPLMDARAGMRVLDACAAPGGKMAHLLETLGGNVTLVALERVPERATLIEQTLARGGWSADVRVGDATNPHAWWDGQRFERILLDAPCSGTGVIRRHPDIKALRRDDDIAALQHHQEALLTALWPLLTPHGLLLYSTCSILPQENEEVIGRFAAMQEGATPVKLDISIGRPAGAGIQILPGVARMDGFFYAGLTKAA